MAGALCGLSAIARPSILIVAPVAAVWLWKRVPSRRQRHTLAFAIALVSVILPITIRNAVRGHDFVPIASQGGVNFYIGNNEQSNGVTAVVPGTRADWWGGFDDTRRIAEQNAGRSLKPSGVSRYWYRQGFRFLMHEPGNAVKLYARKTALLLGNSEPSNERQLYFRRQSSRVLTAMRVNFAALLAAALIALVSLRSSPGGGGFPPCGWRRTCRLHSRAHTHSVSLLSLSRPDIACR
jgi:hypothetical protein